jgi:hypothetical protein
MWDQVIISAALAGTAPNHTSWSSGAKITGVRYSSPGVWNWRITGCSSALTVSVEKLTIRSPEAGSVQRSQSQAIANGSPEASSIFQRTALPDSYPGS